MADSLSIYAEGTFEEQIQELVKYLARPEREETRARFIRPFQELLSTPEGSVSSQEDQERRRKAAKSLVAEIKGLGDGNDREIEGFFNMVYCHVLTLYPPDSADSTELVNSLIAAITSSAPTEHTTVKYRVLTNLYNAIPNRSTLRSRVYQALLNLATENEGLEVLQLKPSDIEKWLDEWDISDAEKSDFIKSVSDAFIKLGQETTAYSYMVSYLRTISPNSPKAEADSLSVIATALRLPSIFNFDSLLKIDAVRVARDHPLFSLLKIFLGGGLTEYRDWLKTHESVLTEFSLDKLQLERKIKLLVLADLGSKNVGRDVPYSEIAAALEVDKDQVEIWVIDVIRARLLSGRLSQPDETLHVTRSTSRSFGQEEWETVEKRLVAWKTGLAGVLEVIAAARKTASAAAASHTLTPEATRPFHQPQAA